MFSRAVLLLVFCGVASLSLLGGGGTLIFRGEKIWMIAAGVGMIIAGMVAAVVTVLKAIDEPF